MDLPYLELSLGFMILKYVFKTYLNIRQHRVLKLVSLPQSLEGLVTEEKFEKYRSYSLDKRNFNFVREAVTILMDTAVLYLGLLPWIWMKSGELVTLIGLSTENEIAHTLSFLAGVMICYQKTAWLLIRDVIKKIFLSILFGPPAVAAIIYIDQIGGPYLAIYLWVFVSALTIGRVTVYHFKIAPLFHKFTPLSNGGLWQKIEKLATSVNFPLKRLLVVHRSIGSSYGAYMYGLFKNKVIVLYKPLIEKCSNEEIVAGVAHEFGHWKLNHTLYSFIAFEICTFLQFGWYALVSNSKDLYQSLGFETQPVIIGIIVYHYIIPLQQLVGIGRNLVNRANEFQADTFAMRLGYSSSLRAAVLKLQEVDSSAMITDPWYSACHYFDPPIVERLSALGGFDSKEMKEEKSNRRKTERRLDPCSKKED